MRMRMRAPDCIVLASFKTRPLPDICVEFIVANLELNSFGRSVSQSVSQSVVSWLN